MTELLAEEIQANAESDEDTEVAGESEEIRELKVVL
jgi:hypothetical protein